MKKITRDDTEHGKEYYLASDVDALLARPIIKSYLEKDNSQEQVEKFCDTNCVWTDHHPDCKLAQPEQEYKRGYADAMNWKVQNHLEHLQPKVRTGDCLLTGVCASEGHKIQPKKPEQEPVAWKLVPIEPTEEMLKAMDECSIEGYDERLYAGHAASVYMAAVDAALAPPQPKEPDLGGVGVFHPQEPEQEPVAMRYDFDGYGWKYIDSGSGSDWQTRIKDAEPLYTTPPQRTWVGLTDEEFQLIYDIGRTPAGMMEMVEAKLKEKNT